MLKEQSCLTAERSEKYGDMLSKHFARKAEVEINEGNSVIKFAMGTCTISAQEEELNFLCEAKDEECLDTVKGIIDGHIHLLKAVRDVKLNWNKV